MQSRSDVAVIDDAGALFGQLLQRESLLRPDPPFPERHDIYKTSPDRDARQISNMLFRKADSGL